MEFLVNLIVINKKQTERARESIKVNCIKMYNNVYTMEGDINCLVDEEVEFNLIDTDAVGCLGGLSTKKLVETCEESFGIDVRKLKYNKKNKYVEDIN